eukprot:280829-Chlamydomonas_euryale.AAC.13
MEVADPHLKFNTSKPLAPQLCRSGSSAAPCLPHHVGRLQRAQVRRSHEEAAEAVVRVPVLQVLPELLPCRNGLAWGKVGKVSGSETGKWAEEALHAAASVSEVSVSETGKWAEEALHTVASVSEVSWSEMGKWAEEALRADASVGEVSGGETGEWGRKRRMQLLGSFRRGEEVAHVAAGLHEGSVGVRRAEGGVVEDEMAHAAAGVGEVKGVWGRMQADKVGRRTAKVWSVAAQARAASPRFVPAALQDALRATDALLTSTLPPTHLPPTHVPTRAYASSLLALYSTQQRLCSAGRALTRARPRALAAVRDGTMWPSALEEKPPRVHTHLPTLVNTPPHTCFSPSSVSGTCARASSSTSPPTCTSPHTCAHASPHLLLALVRERHHVVGRRRVRLHVSVALRLRVTQQHDAVRQHVVVRALEAAA